jgi:hypothetical protein
MRKAEGYVTIARKVKHVVYKYFPENWRLCVGLILHAGLSYIQVNTA